MSGRKSQRIKRIAVLYSKLSGYSAACLRELRKRHDVDLLVYRWMPAKEAPFSDETFEGIGSLLPKDGISPSKIVQRLGLFSPQLIFMAGWMDRDYLSVARSMRRRGVPVIAGSDTQWKGSLRQYAARAVSRFYLHSAIDVLWVAGERQRQLARRLGYSGRQCEVGYYTCDWPRFADVFNERKDVVRRFLYVGRFIERKGLDVLIDAFQRYNKSVSEPWELHCAGSGPDEIKLHDVPGVVNRGFVQPSLLPKLYSEASVFILPSREEPWGVVAHEAATSGMALICSDVCGAAVHLLQDDFNGYGFASGDADHLARRMALFSRMSDDDIAAMGEHSHLLSKQFTPARWSDTLVRSGDDLLAN